jgi:homoserine kinase type II
MAVCNRNHRFGIDEAYVDNLRKSGFMSNKLDRPEIAEMLEQYFSAPNFDYSRIESGSSNSTYRISLNDQIYVLTIFESNNSDHVADLTLILKQLEERGIKSSRVVATTDGRLYSAFNDKPILLKEFIAGEELTHAAMTDSIASDIGMELARLHGAGNFNSRRETQHYGLDLFEGIAADLPKGEIRGWFLNEYERVSNEFPSGLPMGFVHSDVFPNNIIIEDGQFKCLLDFEYLSYFPLVFDLACGIVGLAWQDDVLNVNLSRSLIRGYEMERQLGSNESKNLDYFCQYIALFFAGWRYRQFNVFFPNPERSEDYIVMIDIVETFKNKPPCLE